MIYACHQPDLLPYSGFWYKMAKSNIYDVKIWDQFVEKGYQRRVKMRDQWVTLPLVKTSPVDPINTKRIKPEAPAFLADAIVKRYTASYKNPPFWDRRAPQICDEILSIKTDLLWEFNLRLILVVRNLLGIDTPLTLSRPCAPGARGAAGIISIMESFGTPMTYLSGTGARAYMADCREFTDAGISVMWSRHRPVTGDSILTLIFDYEDPLSMVLAEEPHAHDRASRELEAAVS